MSIPCYFAENWKESVNNSDFSYAQTGFGLQEDGSARLNPCAFPALCVIDDSILPLPKEEAIDRLAENCQNGGCLDFAKPVQTAHIVLLSGLQRRCKEPLAVPARFLTYSPKSLPLLSCPRPCNSWLSYVQGCRQRYPKGWVLELTPWRHISPCRMKQASGRLKSALCEYRCERGITQYYDTKETLREKIKYAEDHGCIAAIGLYSEWESLP